MEEVVVRGVSLEKNQAKVTISGVPDQPGVAAKIFTLIAQANLNIDMIVQNVSIQGTTDITFTLNKDDLLKARKTLDPVVKEVKAKELIAQEGVSKLSVVGIGMRSHSGVASTLFTALADAKINVQMISTSEIKISVIIDEASGPEATKIVHDAFLLKSA